MIIYISLKNGYVSGWGTTKGIDDLQIELEKNHPFFTSDFNCWKYVDGELVFDEEKRQRRENERIEEENKLSENDMLAMAIMDLTELIMGGID